MQTKSDHNITSKLNVELVIIDGQNIARQTISVPRTQTSCSYERREDWKRGARLGKGGGGEVYVEECVDGESKGNQRAVKAVKRYRRNFEREIEAAVLFSHSKYQDSFVTSFGWYEMPEDLCLAMEYLPLGSLRSPHFQKPMRELDVRLIVRQVLQGLEHMRAHGFVHRDLKPDNILVQQGGPSWWVKIADFGISKRAKADSEAADTGDCTGGFEAPEQRGIFRVACSHATDIFATGCVTYLLLSNHLAFLADNGESLARFCDPDNTKRETERLCRPLNNEKVSLDGINFIFMLLKPDPTKRPEARRCLDHSWTNPVSPTTADSVIPQETAETANLVNLDGSWGTISSSTGLWLGQETAEQDDKLAGQEAKGDQPPGPGPVRMLSDASKASGSWSVTFKAADTVQRMTTVGEEPQVEALAQSSPRQTRSLSEQISVVPHHSSTSPPCTHFTSSHPSQLYGMGLASQNRTFSVPTQTPSTNGSYIIHPPQPYGTGLANQGRAVSMPAQTPSPQGSYTSHPPQYDDSGYHSPASLQVSPVPTKNHDAWTGAGAGITAFETPPGPRRGDSMAEIMSGSPIERWTTDPGAYMGNQYPQYTASPRASMDSLMPGYGPHPAPRVRNIQNTPSPKTSFDSLSPDSLPRAAHRVRSRVSFSSDTDRGNTGPGAYTTNRHSQHAPSPGASFDSLMPDDMLHTARRVRSMVSVGSNSNAIQWERQIEVGLSSRCVMTLTLSDNGQYGASWCQDSILRVWDPRSGQHRGQSEIKDVTSLLFSPDSAILAVRTKRALKLFMMKEPPFRMSRRVTIDGNHTVDRPFASECMFSKDSQRIAVPSAGTGRVWLLYTADGALLGKLDTSGASVTSIAISPYLRTLAVGLGDNTVRTWNLQDYSERKTLRHNACAPAHVTRVAYSINGLVAASSTSGILKIWDEDGCTVETRPQGCRLLDCAFCPVGDLVATADDGGCIRFFDPTTAAELESHYIQHKEQGPVLRVLFSPDGVFGVSCGYKTLEVWHTATANVLYRSQLQSNDGCGVKACFSKGHDILAVAFEGGVQLLDLGILRARITV